jgi:HAD superfamily hydrolase (TIGR01509 family)
VATGPEIVLAEVAAVLFDVDGTLCDSLPLHFQAYNRALAELSVGPVEWVDYVEGCLRHGGTVEDLLAGRGLAIDPPRLLRAKNRWYREIAFRGLRPRDGLQALWTALRAHGMRIGVVSTGRRSSVEVSLACCALPGSPDVIVAREDLGERIKPDPHCYHLAAHRAAVAPGACVAFDDAPAGMAAAVAAGMRCVGVKSRIFGAAEVAGALAVIGDFTQVEPRTCKGGPALAVRI